MPDQSEPLEGATKVEKWRTCITVHLNDQSEQSKTDQSRHRVYKITNQSQYGILPIDQSELKLDNLDFSSTSSQSSAHMSVSSHEVAIRMLDRAIDSCLSDRETVKHTSQNKSPVYKDKHNSPDKNPVSRERLARTVAEAILAKSPRSDDIIDDLKTDKEEFFKESNKAELVQRLQEEYVNSPKGKWHIVQKLLVSGVFQGKHVTRAEKRGHMTSELTNHKKDGGMLNNHRQRQPSKHYEGSKTVIAVSYNEIQQNGYHGNNPTVLDRKARSKVKFSAGEPVIIDVNGNGQYHHGNQETNHHRQNNNVAPSTELYRGSAPSAHNSTNILPEVNKYMSEDDDKPLYDFRKLLRKTGRLEVIAAEM